MKTTMRSRVRAYWAERRALGFRLRSEEQPSRRSKPTVDNGNGAFHSLSASLFRSRALPWPTARSTRFSHGCAARLPTRAMLRGLLACTMRAHG